MSGIIFVKNASITDLLYVPYFSIIRFITPHMLIYVSGDTKNSYYCSALLSERELMEGSIT